MTDKSSDDKFQGIRDAWETAMGRQQFKVALKAGIDAYLLGEADGNELEAESALGRMHLAMAQLIFGKEPKLTSAAPSCSFCGQSGPDVRLGAGPDAFICADCVGIFYEEVGLKPDRSSKQP